MKRILLLLAALAAACGGNSAPAGSAKSWRDLANICAVPQSSTDKKGTNADENAFLWAWSNDTYLWYRELPAASTLDANQSPATYFAQLKTQQPSSTGNTKDKFHFTYPTAVWNQLSQSGVEVGYGMEVVLLAPRPPRDAVVAYTESPPATDAVNGIHRGLHITTVDGVDLVNGTNVNALNAGLFPANAGEPHTFVFHDPATNTDKTVTLTSVAAAHAPVQNVGTVAGFPDVGYMQFNDHLATAEKALTDAIKQLSTANAGAPVKDLVVDMRYNGGGFLAIASELAFMIAGPATTSGRAFERTIFNDKHQSTDPVTGQALQPTPFLTQTVGLSVPQGQALPFLGLRTLYVLTGPNTCSASESVINGLRGVNVNVVQIGSTTCGKPYGFYAQDNCGTTYFTIQFQGVNAQGFGDYPDGFVPGVTNNSAGCQVGDDFTHALGDPNERRLAAALQYRTNATCPPATFARSNALTVAGSPSEGIMVKPFWRENRLYRGL